LALLNELIIISLRAGNNLITSKGDEYSNYAPLLGFVEAENWQNILNLSKHISFEKEMKKDASLS
jgi:hypothetical protein